MSTTVSAIPRWNTVTDDFAHIYFQGEVGYDFISGYWALGITFGSGFNSFGSELTRGGFEFGCVCYTNPEMVFVWRIGYVYSFNL